MREETITSRSNDKARFIRSLNGKKARILSKCFYLEGIKVVNEVIEKKGAINLKFIAYSEELLLRANGGKQILNKIRMKEYAVSFSKYVFESLTDTKTPQGILAVLEYSNDFNITMEDNILVLDRVQDQGNLGTIIRSADAFGIHQIICTQGTADVYSPKVLRSTMGSILREKIIYVDDIKKIERLKNKGFNIVGTTLNDKSMSIEKFDFLKKSVFVIGNEANGISKDIENICDYFIKIPMTGSTESLNVAVATSIILYKQFKK